MTAISSDGLEQGRIDGGIDNRVASNVSRMRRRSEGEVADRVEGRMGMCTARRRE